MQSLELDSEQRACPIGGSHAEVPERAPQKERVLDDALMDEPEIEPVLEFDFESVLRQAGLLTAFDVALMLNMDLDDVEAYAVAKDMPGVLIDGGWWFENGEFETWLYEAMSSAPVVFASKSGALPLPRDLDAEFRIGRAPRRREGAAGRLQGTAVSKADCTALVAAASPCWGMSCDQRGSNDIPFRDAEVASRRDRLQEAQSPCAPRCGKVGVGDGR